MRPPRSQLKPSKARPQFFEKHSLKSRPHRPGDVAICRGSTPPGGCRSVGVSALLSRGWQQALNATPPQYRTAVSRDHHCMYHAMRAVVYFVSLGDDLKLYKDLPAKTPSDFVNAAVWQTRFKDARAQRNEADYASVTSAPHSFRGECTCLEVDVNRSSRRGAILSTAQRVPVRMTIRVQSPKSLY